MGRVQDLFIRLHLQRFVFPQLHSMISDFRSWEYQDLHPVEDWRSGLFDLHQLEETTQGGKRREETTDLVQEQLYTK